jgi:hypothetical protein
MMMLYAFCMVQAALAYSGIAGNCLSAGGGHGSVTKGTGGFKLEIAQSELISNQIKLTLSGTPGVSEESLKGYIVRTSGGNFTFGTEKDDDETNSGEMDFSTDRFMQNMPCPVTPHEQMKKYPPHPQATISHTSSWSRLANKLSVAPLTLALNDKDQEVVSFMVIIVGNYGTWWQFQQHMKNNDRGGYYFGTPEPFDPFHVNKANLRKPAESLHTYIGHSDM